MRRCIPNCLFLGAVILSLLPSCAKEQSDHSAGPGRVCFSLEMEDYGESGTKSLLTDALIETKLTSLTVAVYNADGQLFAARHLTGGFNTIPFALEQGATYTLYALANMGDRRADFPTLLGSEAELAGITYSIPGYGTAAGGTACLNARGLPMAGKLVYDTAAPDGSVIPLKRLMAKVNVHLQCLWGGSFRTVTLHNVNRTLKPFGQSAAASAIDLLPESVEVESASLTSAAASGDFVLYVPENIQGTIPAVTTSKQKSRDNAAVTGAALKSYIQVVVTPGSGSGYYGSITYRSYLGGNDTSDFNIERNTLYNWSVSYLGENVPVNDWKRDGTALYYVSGAQYRNPWVTIGTSSLTLPSAGGSAELSVSGGYEFRVVYSNGTFGAWTPTGGTPALARTSGSSAFALDGTTVSVGANGSTASRSARFTATMAVPDGSVSPATDYVDITQSGAAVTYSYEYKAVTTLDRESVYVGGTATASAALYRRTVTNGTPGAWAWQRDVSSSGFTATAGAACVSISGTAVTGASAGTATIRSRYSADYYENASLEVKAVTVDDTQYRNLSVSISASPATLPFEGGTSALTVTGASYEYRHHYSDGSWGEWTAASGTPVVSDNGTAGFTRSGATSVTAAWNSAATPRTLRVTASYTIPGTAISASDYADITQEGDPNGITLTLSPTTVTVDQGIASAVSWNADGRNITSNCIIRAYTSATGSTTKGNYDTYAGRTQIKCHAAGTYYFEAAYTVSGRTYRSPRVQVTVTAGPADSYTITLSPKPGSVQVGKTLQYSYTMTKNGGAFTPASGDIAWSVDNTATATVSATGLVSGIAAGNTTVRVSYKGGTVSDAGALTVSAPPATPVSLGWSADGKPAYVAQRGKLTVSGLLTGESVSSFAVTSGSGVVRLTQSGSDCYVGLLKSGSYTVTVTTSSGRTGTVSGTVTAPTLTLSQSTLYANPDGSDAHTGSDGLTGSTQAVSYKAGTTTLSTTAAAIAVGSSLYKSLYDELLAPQYSPSGAVVHAGGDGVWAQDVYSSTGRIATVTVSPRDASCGVASKSFSVNGVDPFSAWGSTVADKGDIEDWGLLSGYYAHGTSYSGTFQASAIRAASGSSGMTVFVNGAEAGSDLRSAFSGNVNDGTVSWSLSQSVFAGFSSHSAGDVVLKAYVRNSRSGACLYHDFAKFRLFVHGAVGGTVALKSPRIVAGITRYQALYVQVGFTGNIAGTPFANNTANGSVIYTIASGISAGEGFDHGLGTCPFYIVNSQGMANFSSGDDFILNVIPGEKASSNPDTYRPSSSMYFIANDRDAFRMTVGPDLSWGTVRSSVLVKKAGNALYMRSSTGEPTRTVGGVNTCGYYVLHLLDDVQTSSGIKGWL